MQSAAGSSASSAPTVAVAAVPTASTSYPFFELPRELRDQIYSYATISRSVEVVFHDFRATFIARVETTAAPKMLLVSKQFKREYEEEVARSPGSRLADMIVWPCADSIDFQPSTNISAPSDRAPLRKLFSQIADLKVHYYPRRCNFSSNELRGHMRTFTSFMPNLKCLLLDSPSKITIYEAKDYKENLDAARAALLYDDNGVRDRHFVIKGAITLSCQLFDINAKEAVYRRLLRPGNVEMDHIEMMFNLHPGNRTLLRMTESNQPHTFHGFDIEVDPAPDPLSFEEIESDVVESLELSAAAKVGPFNRRAIENWAAALRGRYKKRLKEYY